MNGRRVKARRKALKAAGLDKVDVPGGIDTLEDYNKRLQRYGLFDDGRPRFRITVTAGPHQLEKRIGHFTDWYGNIFIREYVGMREGPKYAGFWNYAEEPHWVIEQLMFAPMEDLPNWREGSYEPFYIFPWIEGKPVLPPWRAIELLFHTLFFGPKKTVSDYASENDEQFKKEVELFEQILDEEGLAMAGAFQTGAASAMPSSFEAESPLLRRGV